MHNNVQNIRVGFQIPDEDYKKISGMLCKEIAIEDLATFEITLCTNQIDRDFEAFHDTTIVYNLLPMYDGKTGFITDSIRGRIYETYTKQIKKENNDTEDGTSFTQTIALIGKVFIINNTAETRQFIMDIEDGYIKDNISISCSCLTKQCSICGADVFKNPCNHKKGNFYNNRLCYYYLEDVTDVYEWAFVKEPDFISDDQFETEQDYSSEDKKCSSMSESDFSCENCVHNNGSGICERADYETTGIDGLKQCTNFYRKYTCESCSNYKDDMCIGFEKPFVVCDAEESASTCSKFEYLDKDYFNYVCNEYVKYIEEKLHATCVDDEPETKESDLDAQEIIRLELCNVNENIIKFSCSGLDDASYIDNAIKHLENIKKLISK